MNVTTQTIAADIASFAPVLYLHNVADGITFYTNAFDALELRRWSNEDGSVHVAEMMIGDALFHLHEEVARQKELNPATLGGTSVVIGLFIANPDETVTKAIAAGATIINPVQDYDYGYRQADITDPFGHHWDNSEKSLKKYKLINNSTYTPWMLLIHSDKFLNRHCAVVCKYQNK